MSLNISDAFFADSILCCVADENPAKQIISFEIDEFPDGRLVLAQRRL